MIRTVKQTALSTMKTAGVFDMASRSRWRNGRLLILGYHGIAQENEHLWNPSLFIAPEHLAARLRFLRAGGFNILRLDDAIRRLNTGTLPERSVAITFDDGYVDFHRLAWPILRAYDVPAAVYLTTYYSEHNRPVPGITAAYMVWMSRKFTGPLTTVPGFEGARFTNAAQRYVLSDAIGRYFTDERALSPDDKHRMIEEMAAEVGFNLTLFRRRRLMHVMNPDEVREVAAAGIDIELHTHRHWVPKDEALIRREIVDNRARIEAIAGRRADHFCYPSGIHYPELLPWLRALGVRSATTCEPGLASADDDPLLLPRFLDHSGVSLVEFEAWATGIGSVLPRRPAYELAIR
ncbi:MAG TPA: polysaccharide deacetylase family protein [Vicinamibacterales bacterium]|nr:polysaccharide deacetylase family protein [Vicinamibacterales bacterium]